MPCATRRCAPATPAAASPCSTSSSRPTCSNGWRSRACRDELLALLDEEPGISILVLAAGTGSEGPGPLVTQLVGKMSGRLRVPITVVPGSLTDEQIAALS